MDAGDGRKRSFKWTKCSGVSGWRCRFFKLLELWFIYSGSCSCRCTLKAERGMVFRCFCARVF